MSFGCYNYLGKLVIFNKNQLQWCILEFQHLEILRFVTYRGNLQVKWRFLSGIDDESAAVIGCYAYTCASYGYCSPWYRRSVRPFYYTFHRSLRKGQARGHYK